MTGMGLNNLISNAPIAPDVLDLIEDWLWELRDKK
jgi:hypothetical protein